MRIQGGYTLGFDNIIKFTAEGQFFVGIYDDVIDGMYGKLLVAYSIETNVNGIEPLKRVAIPLTTQIQRSIDTISKNRVFSLEYLGKRTGRSNRMYKLFRIKVYSKEEVLRAYPELQKDIEALLEAPF